MWKAAQLLAVVAVKRALRRRGGETFAGVCFKVCYSSQTVSMFRDRPLEADLPALLLDDKVCCRLRTGPGSEAGYSGLGSSGTLDRAQHNVPLLPNTALPLR